MEVRHRAVLYIIAHGGKSTESKEAKRKRTRQKCGSCLILS